MTTNPKPRVLSGMRPTGKLHLGNYVGALENWVALQNSEKYECFFFIADWHALTTDYDDTSRIKSNILEVALDYLAAGLDPQHSQIFVQSHVAQHAELHLLLSMIAPLGMLERVPTYKEQIANLSGKDLLTYGFLGYPVLQSADVLLYGRPNAMRDSQAARLFVPVGEDQVSHLELTRELARKFNAYYHPLGSGARIGGINSLPASITMPTLAEPEPLLTPAKKLPGTDGRKMSKSYGNYILLTDSSRIVEQKLAGMVNDPARFEKDKPGNPDVCPVGDLHKIFSNEVTNQNVNAGCRGATIGCVECKQWAAHSINVHLQPIQERRSRYEAQPERVLEVLEKGARRARKTAEVTMRKVREAMGLSHSFQGTAISTNIDEEVFGRLTLAPKPEWWSEQDGTKRGDCLRQFWLETHGLPLKMAEEAHRLFVNERGKRVGLPTAREHTANEWVFELRDRHYDVIVFLAWAFDFEHRRPAQLIDLIVPRKVFENKWKSLPQGNKSRRIRIVREGSRFWIAPDDWRVDITEFQGKHEALR